MQAQEGSQALTGSYNSKEGQRVLDSFNVATYPGERDPLAELGIDAGKLGMTYVLGKYVPKVMAKAEELALEKSVAGSAKLIIPAESKIKTVAANEIRFSQKSVSFNKVDRLTEQAYTYDDLVTDMRMKGWKGDPVDVVRMPDGRLTSIDNTRISAARDAGIEVQANIRSFDSPLTKDEVGRFTKGAQVPLTWGEAIMIRIKSQGTGFDMKYPYGADSLPRLTGKK